MPIDTSHLTLVRLDTFQDVYAEMTGQPPGVNLKGDSIPRPTLYHSRYQSQDELIKFAMWGHCPEPLARKFYAIRDSRNQTSLYIVPVAFDHYVRTIIQPCDREFRYPDDQNIVDALASFLAQHDMQLNLDPHCWL